MEVMNPTGRGEISIRSQPGAARAGKMREWGKTSKERSLSSPSGEAARVSERRVLIQTSREKTRCSSQAGRAMRVSKRRGQVTTSREREPQQPAGQRSKDTQKGGTNNDKWEGARRGNRKKWVTPQQTECGQHGGLSSTTTRGRRWRHR